MYAQCPECLTFFHLKPSHLKAANGRVRCSRCKHVFNALETLRDELTPEEISAVEEVRKREPKPDAPLLNEEYAGDLFDGLEYTRNEELGLDADTAESGPPPVFAVDPAASRAHIFAEPRTRKRHSAWAAAGNIVLILLLAAQLVHWQRFEILEYPLAAPYLERVYAALDLSLQPPRNLAVLNVSRTEVSSHPGHPQALYLTAVLQNAGDTAQPWPELHVSLQDRWGETVASRYFKPVEYLRGPDKAGQPLGAGTRHAIELAVLDPGSKAVGFQVEPCFANRSAAQTRHICTQDINGIK